MTSGILAALWLLGLFAAAPLLRGSAREYRFADRLRDALILGIAIPLALGAVHLLYPVACFVALALCTLRAIQMHSPPTSTARAQQPPYLTVAALLVVAWPQLMRPLLDGDSLSYHLPNAAAWVQAHSLWTSATRYWWYPPASELFASGLYTVSGPFALPWCGLCALALLATRVTVWAREAMGCNAMVSDALAAALVIVYPLATQGGTLQNDVWLAAFFVESLWTLRIAGEPAAMRTIAVTALVKPQGWIFAAIALLAAKAPRRVWYAAGAAIAAWLLHDALLVRGALISPAASSAYAHPWSTTILANGLPALWLLARVAASTSPFVLFALAAALFGPLPTRRKDPLGWAALACVLVFLLLPFGYETNVAQLATGTSLRFAAPAIALGALLIARHIGRAAMLATLAFAASAAFGAWRILAVFWNDGSTHAALPLAAVGVALVAVSYRHRSVWPAAAGLAAGVILSTHLAARHPIDYYDDALRVNGVAPGIYHWIATQRPTAVGGAGLRLGVVNVLSPATRTRDLLDETACSDARRSGVLLIAVAQSDLPPQTNAARLAAARACGRFVYADPIGVATAP